MSTSQDINTFANGEFRLSVEPHPVDGFHIQAPGLARALGMRDAYRLLETIPEDEKGYTLSCTPGGNQDVGYLTEAGFYRALGQRQASRIKDEIVRRQVERFQSWVYRDVLPSIRMTGGYAATPTPAPTGKELFALALVEAQGMLESKDEEIAVLEPKADAYEAFMNADGTYSVGRVAKMLGRSQNKLFAELRNAGVLIAKGHMHNTPYQRYMHHFKVTPYSYERKDDTIGCSYTTTVQPSGVEFIRRKLGVPHLQHELEVAS
ncbi:phage antirepressor [Brevibacterium aurantiacum]|uniref:phage antirepressor n=1 Tax=Brevibacterium aurantiacum TaxID=273384 RepID=UPI0013DE5B57|nr:phage antirepressor KilAC domain-containing protein [Brevibacterium aurantiacum]